MRFDRASGLWLPAPSGRVIKSRSLTGGTRHGRLVVHSAPFGHGRKGGGAGPVPPDSYLSAPSDSFSLMNMTQAVRTWGQPRNPVPALLDLQEVAARSPWTNEPGGYTLIQDKVFNIPIDTVQFGSPDASGWAEAYNTGGLGTIQVDGTAPLDNGDVLQEKYPAGYGGGGAPCTYYYDITGHNRLYVGFYWKPSSPWQSHSSSINKVIFLKFGTNNSGLTMYHTGGTSYELRYFPEFLGSWSYRATGFNVSLGAWHKVETLTDTVAGTFSWWLDGTQQGPWTGLSFPAGGITEISISPTWGGTDDTVSSDQYFWYNHVHTSYA